ncbi:MAG: hypothetical protein Q4A98_10925 [Comamonadaceae bacterium]|nr:hypothetical protein [Comamonadaceae bacterium]
MSKSYIAQVPIKTLDAEGRVVVIQPGEVVPEVVGAQDRAELESMKAIAPAASAPQSDASEADADEAEGKPTGKPGNKPNTGKEGKK